MKTAYHFEEGDPVREAREPQPYSEEELSGFEIAVARAPNSMISRFLATIEELREERNKFLQLYLDHLEGFKARDEALREAREALRFIAESTACPNGLHEVASDALARLHHPVEEKRQ